MTNYFEALGATGMELRYGMLLLFTLAPVAAYVVIYLAYRSQTDADGIHLPFDWLIALTLLSGGAAYAALDLAATSQWAFASASMARAVDYDSLARDVAVVCRYDPSTRSADELAASVSRLRRDDVVWRGHDGTLRARPAAGQKIPCDEFATLTVEPFLSHQAALVRVAIYGKPLGCILSAFACIGLLSFIAGSLFRRQRKRDTAAGTA